MYVCVYVCVWWYMHLAAGLRVSPGYGCGEVSQRFSADWIWPNKILYMLFSIKCCVYIYIYIYIYIYVLTFSRSCVLLSFIYFSTRVDLWAPSQNQTHYQCPASQAYTTFCTNICIYIYIYICTNVGFLSLGVCLKRFLFNQSLCWSYVFSSFVFRLTSSKLESITFLFVFHNTSSYTHW